MTTLIKSQGYVAQSKLVNNKLKTSLHNIKQKWKIPVILHRVSSTV